MAQPGNSQAAPLFFGQVDRFAPNIDLQRGALVSAAAAEEAYNSMEQSGLLLQFG